MPGGKAVSVSLIAVALVAVLYILYVLGLFGPLDGRPVLGEGEPVQPEHINWIVKQIGTDKLRIDPTTGKSPEVELVVNPDGNRFTVTVVGGKPNVRAGPSADPDIRLTGDRMIIARLLGAQDMMAEIMALALSGDVQLEMLRSRSQLESMGYASLYDSLFGLD